MFIELEKGYVVRADDIRGIAVSHKIDQSNTSLPVILQISYILPNRVIHKDERLDIFYTAEQTRDKWLSDKIREIEKIIIKEKFPDRDYQ